MSRVVITGGGGFIGQATLKSIDEDTLAIDLTDKLQPNKKYAIAYCDITKQGEIERHIHRGDKVLHLAAIATFAEAEADKDLAWVTNTLGTIHVVEACNKAGAERLLFSSTGSVFSLNVHVPIREDAEKAPPNFYGFTKLVAEHYITQYCRVPWIILRYGYVYGAGKLHGAIGAFLDKLRKNEQAIIYGGKQTNDFTYIRDIVHANMLALFTEYTNQDYNIGSGRANSILDVYDACAKALGKDIKPIIKPARETDWPVFLYDVEKATKLLKYEPQWNITDGIADMVKELEREQSS